MTTLRRAIHEALDGRAQTTDYEGITAGSSIDEFDRKLERLLAAARVTGVEMPDHLWRSIQAGAYELVRRPTDQNALEQHVQALPEPDRMIFREFQSGRLPRAIAGRLGMDQDVVTKVLIRTWADLRMKMQAASH